jgi:hypothetical protein
LSGRRARAAGAEGGPRRHDHRWGHHGGGRRGAWAHFRAWARRGARRRRARRRRVAGRRGQRPVRRARRGRRQAKEERYPEPHGMLQRTRVRPGYVGPLLAQVAQNTAGPRRWVEIDDDEPATCPPARRGLTPSAASRRRRETVS